MSRLRDAFPSVVQPPSRRKDGGTHTHGQIFELKSTGPDGQPLWAYRYRLDGRGSRRIQRGGYASPDAAREALQRALTATQGVRARVTLADLAEEYLAQHDAEPETTAKPLNGPCKAASSGEYAEPLTAPNPG